MINEDKLKLMTSIALFEKREEKRMRPARNYFRGDYVSRSLLRSFVGYTVCWVMVMVLVVLCRAEDFLAILSLVELEAYLIEYGALYVVGLVFYMLLTLVISYRRYSYSFRVTKVYSARLKRLEKRYEGRKKAKEPGKEGKRQ